jgi:hypothetical protein
MSKEIGKNMMIVSVTWNGEPSFKLIPVSEDCPYVECIFDPATKVFVVISTKTKNTFHMLPKLDDNGDPQFLKVGKRRNGKDFKEERRNIETFQEYYLEDLKDAEDIIKTFAVNSSNFDYKTILEKPISNIDLGPEKPTIVTA